MHGPARLEAALDGGQLLLVRQAAAAVVAAVVVGADAAAAAAGAHHTGGGAGGVAGAAPPTLLAGLGRGRGVQGGRLEAGDRHQVLVGHVLLVQLVLELLLLGRLLLEIPGIEEHGPVTITLTPPQLSYKLSYKLSYMLSRSLSLTDKVLYEESPLSWRAATHSGCLK